MDMLIISLLILLGLLFCVMELLIFPGVTIGGVLSVACYGSAIYLAFVNLGVGCGVIVVCLILVLSLVAVCYSLRAKTWDRLSLKSEIESSSSKLPESVLAVGDRGIAISRLSPMGKVEFGSERFEAKSGGEYIDSKSEVEVVGFDNFSVIVKRVN